MRLLSAICRLFALYASAAEPGTRRIEKDVRHELVILPFCGIFDDLAFRSDDEKVQRLGVVTRHSLKFDSKRAVKHIEGVSADKNIAGIRANTFEGVFSPSPTN